MPHITVGTENSGDIRIYYEDHGSGPAVVLAHGYLAEANSWEKQEPALLTAGYRVISYDRRGSGCSSRPASGYDYETLAGDLGILIEELDLRDAVLIGSCFGAGEVIRYLGRTGSPRVRAAVLLAPFPPAPSAGHGQETADRFLDRYATDLTADRPAAIKTFLDLSYNLEVLGGWQVSDQAWQNSFHVAIGVSAAAALGCAIAWQEDLLADLGRILVPVLVVQGAEDRITTPGQAGHRLAAELPAAHLVEIPGGPHAIGWTHSAEVNDALLAFLRTLEVA
jgi:non-heme chloroperoxidase